MQKKDLPERVKKYLEKYASDKWILNYDNQPFSSAVVIPVLAELKNLKRLLYSLEENDSDFVYTTLFIFVVNNKASAESKVKENNKNCISFLNSYKSGKIRVAYIDASSPGNELNEKDGGVGLARKIGLDLAVAEFDYSSTLKNNLVCLDADCTVSSNYLDEISTQFNYENISAAVINFEHDTDDKETSEAIICYEIFLRYYVLGLQYSGSPFAFHTIGSSMACDYESYIKVEGMNKRKAAEDFYFLEKLAKNVKINRIKNATVFPSSRGSWRVPFGTGQRVNRFLTHTQNEYLLYNPASFIILKEWLNAFNNSTKSAEEYLYIASRINEELHNFLKTQNFENDWNKILSHSSSEKQAALQKKRWFDGFRTLKLIHHLRDTDFSQVNMFDALDDIFVKMNGKNILRENSIPSLKIQKEYLTELRRLNNL